ncbi:hypothetical protein L2Y01_23820 [Pseudomonas avellanae]|nr:hypothetical protein [Pseudomonas avellanae]UQW66901.1 hypothetical protein L2Y00_16340 [Pseudomonas avellanae]UQW73707.1 hypothetical protein L2Y01_23820 [Pseudomonas avellanae]
MSERDESMLSGDNLMSFTHNVPPALRQDILDCLQYARLVADDLHSPGQAWRSWLDVYQRTISSTGGRPESRIEEARLKIHRFRDIGKLRLPVVSNSVELRRLYLHSLDSLLASEHAQAFFNNWFVSGRFESFQIIPCAMQSEDEATIMLCSMQMKTLALRPALTSGKYWEGKCRCTPSVRRSASIASALNRFARRFRTPCLIALQPKSSVCNE